MHEITLRQAITHQSRLIAQQRDGHRRNQAHRCLVRAIQEEHPAPGQPDAIGRRFRRQGSMERVLGRAIQRGRAKLCRRLVQYVHTPIVFGAGSHTHHASTAAMDELPIQMQAGLHPVQVLPRMPIAPWRHVPRRMQQMGGPHRADQSTGGDHIEQIHCV